MCLPETLSKEPKRFPEPAPAKALSVKNVT